MNCQQSRPVFRAVQRLFGRVVLIVVVVLGLWYVVDHMPGATRFGCPVAADVAHAAGGGCPGDVEAAATDAGWAANRWATIQSRKITTGLFYDHDGNEHIYVSGEDGHSARSAEVLRQVGAAASPLGTFPAASHVEIKAAVAMRDADETQGVVVINNPDGPRTGGLGCAVALSRVLPRGATLVVWWRSNGGTMRSRRFLGGGGP